MSDRGCETPFLSGRWTRFRIPHRLRPMTHAFVPVESRFLALNEGRIGMGHAGEQRLSNFLRAFDPVQKGRHRRELHVGLVQMLG